MTLDRPFITPWNISQHWHVNIFFVYVPGSAILVTAT